jgi:hypothetical protein
MTTIGLTDIFRHSFVFSVRELKILISKYSLVIPAKAGTHRATAPRFSSDGNVLPFSEPSVRRRHGPRPAAGVTAQGRQRDFFTSSFRQGDERAGGSRILSQVPRSARGACPGLELGARTVFNRHGTRR